MASRVQDTFRFKQFAIKQTQNVHRVGTDGVLLGAWVNIQSTTCILDVGTGTGLIALMLAQRVQNAQIIALEPHFEAFSLAQENTAASPFSQRLSVLQCTLQQFQSSENFDLIVSNPPYFENSLKPPTATRQQQRHADSLTPTDLLEGANRLLTPNGKLAVVLPIREGEKFIQIAQSFEFWPSRRCNLFTKASKPIERLLLELSKTKATCMNESLTLLTSEGNRSAEYQKLTSGFYL